MNIEPDAERQRLAERLSALVADFQRASDCYDPTVGHHEAQLAAEAEHNGMVLDQLLHELEHGRISTDLAEAFVNAAEPIALAMLDGAGIDTQADRIDNADPLVAFINRLVFGRAATAVDEPNE